VLQWSGSAWACASAGTGTITGVTAGTDLTGGGTSGNVTLSLNTSATNGLYAQLAAANTFTANQTVNGNIVADASTLGVLGEANATSGGTVGVGGLAASAAGYGVEGLNTAVGGTGVFGTAPQFGVYGIATGSGNTVGVFGAGADGLQGSGTIHGVYAASAGATGYGVEGVNTGSGAAGGFFNNGNSPALLASNSAPYPSNPYAGIIGVEGLSANVGVPVGALVRYVLAKYATGGSGGLLELGPTMVHRLWEPIERAERADTDAARLDAYGQLKQMIQWLRLPLDDPSIYPDQR